MNDIFLEPTKNIIEVFNFYLDDYIKLNWSESREQYMNESIRRFYYLKGVLYKIVYNNRIIGHFTLYDLDNQLKGLAMFCISNK